jgi:enoyl-[acyl-carrier protein] reductase II
MTELFGIRHPVMLAGANWLTEPGLVAAVSNAGGLGLLATAQYKPEETRKNIREIKKLTDKPFGINQILIGPGAKENIQAAIEEKVPVINYSLGKPWFIDDVHGYGGIVMGTVALSRHARKAEQLGCDALIITGHEAAAHGADVTSLVLIPIVARDAKVPVIAAGGFFSGSGLAAALALGASGISMGTRFMLTKECRLHETFKKICVEASEEDTLYGSNFDGMPGRVLKNKPAERLMKGFPFMESIGAAREVKKILGLSSLDFLRLSITMLTAGEDSRGLFMQARQAIGARRHLLSIEKGDTERGILFAGQSLGGIRDIPTCQELIDRIVREAEDAINRLNGLRY